MEIQGNSYLHYLDRIAEFLNVSPSYLVTGEKTSDNELTAREENLLRKYRGIDEKSRQMIDSLLDYFASKNDDFGPG